MNFKLQRTERVRNVLDGVRLPVGEIVHRVNAPRIARAVVMGVPDPVDDRVAQLHVWRRHIDLSPQDFGPVGVFARPHPLEQVEVFVDAPVAEFTHAARLGGRAFLSGNFFRGRIVYVG